MAHSIPKTAAAGTLALLTGAWLLFRPTMPAPATPAVTVGRSWGSAAPRGAPAAPPVAPESKIGNASASDQPAPLPAAGTESAALPLPADPSGDYEISLTDEQVGALVEQHYGSLFEELRLAPADLARFRALLRERQQAIIDAANSAVLVGINPVREAETVRRVVATAQAEADAALEREMGGAVFAAWRDFDRLLPARNSVQDLARRLASTPEPLRPNQASRLVELFRAVAVPDETAALAQVIYGNPHARIPANAPAFAAASQVLSPRQLEIFRAPGPGDPSPVASGPAVATPPP